MSSAKRVESVDVFRGMAVLGFIIWHAFDLFYSGNRYESPFFRSTILTRVAFVMVSAMVLGLREWKDYRLRDHLGRSLKIMIYPIMIGIGKTIYLKSATPVIEILIYPLWGSGNFTFSILIAIGCLYLLLPLILKNRYGRGAGSIIAAVLLFLEFGRFISLPEFWQFTCISVCCAGIGNYIERIFIKHNTMNIGMFLLGLGSFYLLIAYQDIYWTIRNYTLLQIVLLLIAIIGFGANIHLCREKLPISELFTILGQNSFFVYIGHYVLYVVIGNLFGFHQFSHATIFFTVILCVGVFATIIQVFKKEVVVINRIFF